MTYLANKVKKRQTFMETVQDGQHCGEVHPRRPHACVPFPYIGPYVREVMSKSNNKKLAILRFRPIKHWMHTRKAGRVVNL